MGVAVGVSHLVPYRLVEGQEGDTGPKEEVRGMMGRVEAE